jgi:DNA-binding IscR family transcriptional regulator
MSADATRWAWRQAVSRGSEKLMLLYLAYQVDQDQGPAPTIERMSEATALNRKSVLAALRILEKEGLIQSIRVGRAKAYQLVRGDGG